MRDLGIKGNLGKWLHSFLTDRTQKVWVQSLLSNLSRVPSGVPQGSILGPLLFLIMIGDIDVELRHSKATSFVDDTRVTRKMETEEDVAMLQEDLKRLMDWADRNNMVINQDKFELMRYGPQKNIKKNTNYQVNEEEIESKEQVWDLGVMMCSDGTFSHHISHITSIASKLTPYRMDAQGLPYERYNLYADTVELGRSYNNYLS